MAEATEKVRLSAARDIPFNKLVLSQHNVRKIKAGVSIEDLADDIARRGLLSSLNVRPELDAEGKETGLYRIPAGGRRYRALELLVGQKRLTTTAGVPCIVSKGETHEVEDSLAENVHRAQLHPLDQFRAFQALSEQGLGEDEIAARFFVGTATVKQHLRLASVSPRLLERYANDEMSLEQIMAFSLTDDHVRQEQVWDTVSRSHVKEPYYIRRLLTETAVRADDRRALYVGVKTYEAGGGVVMRDLFDEDRGGWLKDPGLLEHLVFEKLQADAEVLKAAEAWKWVEAALDFPYGHTSGLRRFYGERTEMSADELARYDELKAEHDRLDADYAEASEYSEETENRLGQLGTALDALNDRPHVFDADEVARGGAFISLDVKGALKIERGFVRPEDEPHSSRYDEGVGEFDGEASALASSTGGIAVSGKALAYDQSEEEDDAIRRLPDRLVLELTSARTVALRNALANDPMVAFVAVLHAFVLKTFYLYGSDSCLELTLQSAKFSQIQGIVGTPFAKEIDQRHESWGHDIPKNPAGLWDFLIALDEASQQALFAHCASFSLNAVLEPGNRRTRALAHTDQLTRSIGFNMVDAGWTPTVDNYLGRVTKARILEAVREAKGEQAAQSIDHLKKPDMAREAERLLDGTGWLPEPLRLPAGDHAFEQSSNQAENATGRPKDKAASIDDKAVEPTDPQAYLTNEEGAVGTSPE
ncbi:ParB/RepB/Spo0J family partition protein [Sinorhizobium fredii]|uniref:ParB/RepB/Spo0J family partition protein n=1 Tax=Rhizobium fredii TaxID=380 RepID=UPI0033984C7F